MLSNIKACIFDLDGTVVDSMWVWGSIDYEYLKKHGHEVPSDMKQDIEGASIREVVVYFKERFGIDDSIETIMDDWNKMAFQKYSNEIWLKPHIKDFLNYLKENDIKIGLSTSNSRVLAEAALGNLGVLEYFDGISAGCADIKGKPEPDIYLLTASILGVKPEECLVFEDLCKGIMAGKNAGMKTVAVKDDYSDYQLEEKIEMADYYIEDYIEVYRNNENTD